MKKQEMKMQVVIRFKDYSANVMHRVYGLILTQNEVKTARPLVGGLYYETNLSPLMVIASFEEEGFSFSDFESIEFRPK
jgi:hypothetical protein